MDGRQHDSPGTPPAAPDPDTDAGRLRVLLAEDDPISLEFLAEALRTCGLDVTTCVNGETALGLARSEAWDLLLLDHHLPGLTGDAVLAALDAEPASPKTLAIAITAAADDERAGLLRAGFAEVLSKPISIAALRAALQRHGLAADAALDDAAALRVCGSAATMMRLRRILVEQELPGILTEIDHCDGDLRCLRPTLHRLSASCGFCGTRALAQAVASFQHALTHAASEIHLEAALEAFRIALEETRAALRADLDAESPEAAGSANPVQRSTTSP